MIHGTDVPVEILTGAGGGLRGSQRVRFRPAHLGTHRWPCFTGETVRPSVLPEEGDLDTVAGMLGNIHGGRRAVALDVRADLALCLLEAAAHQDPPRVALLESGLLHADPVVRWTAERLLQFVGHGDLALAPLRDDRDPRVRARLRHPLVAPVRPR